MFVCYTLLLEERKMKNIFLCLLTNRWDTDEFIEWLNEGGAEAEHIVQRLYRINNKFYIDIRYLEEMADEELELSGAYHGVMIDGAGLSMEELEGLVHLGSILAFKDPEEEGEKETGLPFLRLVKNEDDE
jgi:hypothetical protein